MYDNDSIVNKRIQFTIYYNTGGDSDAHYGNHPIGMDKQSVQLYTVREGRVAANWAEIMEKPEMDNEGIMRWNQGTTLGEE